MRMRTARIAETTLYHLIKGKQEPERSDQEEFPYIKTAATGGGKTFTSEKGPIFKTE